MLSRKKIPTMIIKQLIKSFVLELNEINCSTNLESIPLLFYKIRFPIHFNGFPLAECLSLYPMVLDGENKWPGQFRNTLAIARLS